MFALQRFFFLIAFISAFLTLAQEKVALPPGREVIQNGLFNKSRSSTVGWVTRDSGNFGDFKLVPPKKGTKDLPVLKVNVVKTCPRPWYLELRQPLSQELLNGERLFISFEYKLTKGYSFHFYWQKETSPWPKMLSLRLAEPFDEWHKVQVAVPVDEDLPSGRSSLTFHLAESVGELQLRNVHAIAVSPKVDPATLPTSVEPVFGGDFYDKDWRALAQNRMLQNRQSPVSIKVYEKGKPTLDASIKLAQISRPFSVGVEIKSPLLVAGALDNKKFKQLNKQIGDRRKVLPEYRKVVTNRKLFDTVTFSDAFCWGPHEDWGEKLAPKAIALVRKKGMKVHGRGLFIPGFEFTPSPDDYRELDPEKLFNAIIQRTRKVTKKYQGSVDRWEVVYGALTHCEIYNYVGVELLPALYRNIHRQVPKTPLLIGDARGLMEPTTVHVSETVEMTQWLNLEKSKIAGIVLSARLTQPYTAPQAMDKRLGLVGKGLQMPVYIASLELDVARANVQAHMLKDLLLAFFSQDQVAGVSFSNIWQAENPTSNAALYHADMSPKPAAEMLEKLLLETWRTNTVVKPELSGKSKNAKVAWLRAFHGDYELTTTCGKRIVKGNVTIPKGGAAISIFVDRPIGKQIEVKPHKTKYFPKSVQVISGKSSWQTPLAGVDDKATKDKQAAKVKTEEAEKDPAKPAVKPTTKPAVKPTTKPAPKPAAKATPKPAAKPAAKATPKPAAKPAPAPKPAAKATPKPAAKATPKPAAKPAAKATPKPAPTPKPAEKAAPKPAAKAAPKPALPSPAEPAAKPPAAPVAQPAK